MWQSTIDIYSYYQSFPFLFLLDFLVVQACLIQSLPFLRYGIFLVLFHSRTELCCVLDSALYRN